MKPTVTLARIGGPAPAFARCLAIVRSRKLVVYRKEWDYYPDLAPPLSLFRDYLRWRDAGEWPARWPEYEARFRSLMMEPPLLPALSRIAADVEQGGQIVLGCFCKEEAFCHRSLVGEWLRERGILVVSQEDRT